VCDTRQTRDDHAEGHTISKENTWRVGRIGLSAVIKWYSISVTNGDSLHGIRVDRLSAMVRMLADRILLSQEVWQILLLTISRGGWRFRRSARGLFRSFLEEDDLPGHDTYTFYCIYGQSLLWAVKEN